MARHATGESGEADRASEEREDAGAHLVYGIDQRPPLGRSIVYAFQHIFAMILGSITGAVVIGTAVGLDEAQIGRLIGFINIAVGIATIVQVTVGVRLPVIQGSTSGHLPAYLALGTAGVSLGESPAITMQYLGGALLVGALLETAFGLANILRWLVRVVSPMTVGIVIAMVGLGLYPVLNDFIGSAWAYAIGVIVLVLLYYFPFGTTIRTMALFLAVITAYAVALGGTLAGWFPSGHPLHVNVGAIAASPWVTVPQVFPWGLPRFDLGFILAMTIPYVATMLESLGDYIAVSRTSAVPVPEVRRLSRGITVEGAASSLAAVLGGTATSSFSQNVGVVRLTGVASLHVCVVAGVLLILIGLFGKFGAVLGAVPRVILGAVYLTAFGILVMTGLKLILRADVRAPRNEVIIGTSLLLGLALPAYLRENPVEAAGNTALQTFANVFLATPMMVAGIWAFILDNVIPGTADERGLTGWLTQSGGRAGGGDEYEREGPANGRVRSGRAKALDGTAGRVVDSGVSPGGAPAAGGPDGPLRAEEQRRNASERLPPPPGDDE